MTLLDRLKPEFRKQLDSCEITYPTIVGVIKKEMINSISFTQMTVSSAVSLLHLSSDMTLSFNNLDELFNEEKND